MAPNPRALPWVVLFPPFRRENNWLFDRRETNLGSQLFISIASMAPDLEGRASPRWIQRVLVGRNPKRTLARAAILMVVCLVVFNFVLLPIRIQGISMLPTYQDRSVNFVNRLAYAFRPPRRGDVVGIRFSGVHTMLMKRIIGLPGETVAFHEGRAVINGNLLDEPYLKLPCNWEHEPLSVGPDEYYVVGDNRSMEFTLHEQGRAERNRIMGKVLW
jgi:signal peptidase I